MRGSGFDRGGRASSLVRTTPAFVGRRQEVKQFARWLDEAVSGHPSLVLIEGEAGIGKTRLLQEIRSIAQRLGFQVCFGRCSEDLALPFLPFIESLLPELEKLTGIDRVPDPEREIVRARPLGAAVAARCAHAYQRRFRRAGGSPSYSRIVPGTAPAQHSFDVSHSGWSRAHR